MSHPPIPPSASSSRGPAHNDEISEVWKDLQELWREFLKGSTPSENELEIGLPTEANDAPRDTWTPADFLNKTLSTRKGLTHTLVNLVRENARPPMSESGLYKKCARDAFLLMEDADRMEKRQRSPQRLKFVLLIAGFVLAVGSMVFLFNRYGFNDSDLREVSNLAQFIEAFAAGGTIFVGWWIAAVFIELRLRTRRALREIHRCRSLIQVIDSHVLSNEWTAWWLEGANPNFAPEVAPEEFNKRLLTKEDAVDYLMFAAALARIVAKIAAVHAQWISRQETTSDADELFRVSTAIELNCIQKVRLVREFREESKQNSTT